MNSHLTAQQLHWAVWSQCCTLNIESECMGVWTMDNCHLIHGLNWTCSFSSSAIPCIRDFFNKSLSSWQFHDTIDGSRKWQMSGQRKWGLEYARLYQKSCKFSGGGAPQQEGDTPPLAPAPTACQWHATCSTPYFPVSTQGGWKKAFFNLLAPPPTLKQNENPQQLHTFASTLAAGLTVCYNVGMFSVECS